MRRQDSYEVRVRTGDARGFSLVEVLVAVIILGVSLVGLTQGITLSLQCSKDAERHTAAVLLAAGRLETVRAEDDFIAGEESGEFDGISGYRWSQTIAAAGPEGLFDVRVDILPEEKDGAGAGTAPYYRLETQLFRKPQVSSFDDTAGEESETERRRRRGAEAQTRRRETR